MKKTKRFISLFLVIYMMLMCMLIPGVAAMDTMEESLMVGENTDELMPTSAAACSHYFHFSDLKTWENGNCQSVTITEYHNGQAINSWTEEYPETGDEAFKFHGCQCPNCQ